MAHFLAFPVFRAFTENGAVLAGGKLYSYEAGTSTPLATYTDKAGGTPNANPVVLDANGEASVWISDAAYKFILTDADDVTLWTRDNISHINLQSIVLEMLPDGILANSTAGREKMADGFLSASSDGLAKMADGFLAASAAGLAKMADGFLAASAAGRAKMADGFVTTGKINDLAVTEGKIGNLAVSTGKINDLAVTTGKIAAGAVTQAKRAAVPAVITSPSGAFSSSDTAYVSVTNLNSNFTTTGRPVVMALQPSSPTVGGAVASSSGSAFLEFRRDSTVIGTFDVTGSIAGGAYWLINTTAAGNYNYNVRVKTSGAGNITVTHMQLALYEL